MERWGGRGRGWWNDGIVDVFDLLFDGDTVCHGGVVGRLLSLYIVFPP